MRRAPLPPRQRALSTPIRVPPPRRAVPALRCVVAALLSQHGGPSADLHTARGPQDGPPPLLRQREAASGRRHGRGPEAASRLETKWGGGSARLGSVQLGTARGKGLISGACTRTALARPLFTQSFPAPASLFNRKRDEHPGT